ncbi:MAG: PilZ domain-containing protein [Treponema sp.]|nr:PilZ domain-containing protein [Treponema sp.]
MSYIFLLQAGGTLAGRDELKANLFYYLLPVFIVAIVVAAIFFIVRYFTTYKTSAAYLEKQKSRPTRPSDIQEVARVCQLVSEEKNLLWQICKDNNTSNILYLVRDFAILEDLFKKEFAVLDENKDESSKSYLFSLRQKIKDGYGQGSIIKTSRAIEEKTVFTFTPAKGYHYKLVLVENTKTDLILLVPDDLMSSDEKPVSASKIELVFGGSDNVFYKLRTRAVRYDKGKTGNLLVVVHSDDILPLQKRGAERIDVNMPCKFASVKTVVVGTGKKENIKYEHSDKLHEGVLEDVSVGGCRITADLPIRAEQYIYIEGPMNMRDTDSAIGSIVRTTKRSDGKFILHIRFLKVEVATVNRILAKIANFSS